MPKFKHPKTGVVIDVPEGFAEQVLRPQGIYIEVKDNELNESTSDAAKTRNGTVQGKRRTSKKKQSSSNGAGKRPSPQSDEE